MFTRQPKAIVRLDIGEKEEQIYVYEGDDVGYLVQYFCERHGLGQECVQFVTQKVNEQLNGLAVPPSSEQIISLRQETLRAQIQEKLLEHHYNKIQKNKHKKQSSIYDKLHQEASELQQNKDELNEKSRQISEQKVMQGVSFHPQVSPTNNIILSKLKRNQTQMNICDYLYEESQNMRERKRFAIESRLKEEDEFQRQSILSPRHQNMRKSRSTISIHDRLHKEAKERSISRVIAAQKIFNKIHPFKPIISKSPKPNVRTQLSPKVSPRYRKPQEDKLTFKPIVNHDDYWRRAGRKKEIQDEVIAQQIKNGKLRLKTFSKSPHETRPRINKHYERQQYNKDKEWSLIQEIFVLLDGDGDGLISANQIELNQIDLRVLECIASVLLEMEEHGSILDAQGFYSACVDNAVNNTLVQELLKDKPYPRYDQSRHDYERILYKIKF